MAVKKYTYEFVNKFFHDQGYQLLETEYVHIHNLMKCKCPAGHNWQVRWYSFRNGARCAKCKGVAKLTLDEVRKVYKDNGCELLDKEYVNATTSMKFKCKCGNIYKKPYYTFYNHPTCNRCGKTCKPTFDRVSEFYEKYGCKLLDEYINNKTPMKFLCKCGRTSSTSFKTFKKSHQCSECSGIHHWTYEEVKKYFEGNGCELLSKEYKNNSEKLDYICKCGRTSKITFDKFKSGGRCKECGIKRGKDSPRWNPDRELVKLNAVIASRSLSLIKSMLKIKLNELTVKNPVKHYLGYEVSELRSIIVSHPNWEKIKDSKWHIDHIFPIKAFLEYGITDLKIINHLDNLQPLSQKDNLSKSAKYDKEEFEKWLIEHRYNIISH